ncbi:enoyl-CoA hydratase/isomerase family protein [Salipaludibacillus daqingensis]|uniref:enoyl-CoA hydratase/isomerase family protein n=1 Tax=Salipaludibacillus daqingensis TaxID=3041001 RepID=UPI0024736392|nr:enoyl-CoA hydratase [Salipaludibacillus daqingensis]
MKEYVSVEKKDGVATITVDRPPLNVLSKQVFKELGDVFDSLEHDNEAVAVVFTTAGEKAFVAGADIKEFPEMIGNKDMKKSVMEGHDVLNRIDAFPKPTIVVLDGLTLGGGCELALAFDIRIAEEQATIGLPEIKLGIFPGGGGTQRLPRLVGEAKAKEMMYTGESVSAAEAKSIGLVNQVTATGEGITEAMKMAGKMSGYSLEPLSRIKKAVNQGMELNFNEAIELEADLFKQVFHTEDVKEGLNAFMEKRKPTFSHK